MKSYFSLLFILVLFGCSTTKKLEYSFFIAGHAYGDPDNGPKNIGLHKPFKDKMEFINSQENMKHGFLLGDVVWGQNFWKRTKEDIDKFKMPIHVSRGNHDGKLAYFEKLFGKSYQKFFVENDLIIVLDLNLDHWNITGDQLTFLKNALRNDGKKADNIFIFSHQVLWYDRGKFPELVPNSLHDKSKETNYWTEIEPLLTSTKKPVFVFAGDVGAFSMERRKRDKVVEYFYHKENNITYAASGMGGKVRDNIVIVDVYNDNSVGFRLVHLNGNDMYSLGKLEDYINPN